MEVWIVANFFNTVPLQQFSVSLENRDYNKVFTGMEVQGFPISFHQIRGSGRPGGPTLPSIGLGFW